MRWVASTPFVDVPVTTYSPTDTVAHPTAFSGFCVLYGYNTPFSPATLATLYPNHGQYVAKVARESLQLVHEGFWLRPDAIDVIRAAAHADVPQAPGWATVGQTGRSIGRPARGTATTGSRLAHGEPRYGGALSARAIRGSDAPRRVRPVIKATVLYEIPGDTSEFDSYYFSTHVPLVNQIPGMDNFEVVVYGPNPDGSPPAYHLIAGLYFPDAAALQAGLGSPEGQATTADVANFPGSPTPTIIVGEVR